MLFQIHVGVEWLRDWYNSSTLITKHDAQFEMA